MQFGLRYLDPGTPGANEGGGGTPAVDEKEASEFQALSERDQTTFNEEEKKRWTTLSEKYTIEEVDEKGQKVTDEAKKQFAETKKKVDAILAKEESTRTEEEKTFLAANTEPDEQQQKKSLYEQVDEINDMIVDVDYEGNGIKDPTSAEGIALRESTIREQAVIDYEQTLKEKAPRAHDFMLHLLNGGKEEDFFAADNEDFSKIKLTKDDLGGSERLYRKALALKGNSPDEIDTLVQTAKDSKKLFEKATSELEALQEAQSQRNAANLREAKAKEQAFNNQMADMADQVENLVTKGDLGGVAVPYADRKKFMEYLGQVIVHNGKNGFNLMRPIKKEDIAKVLKTEYFNFKGGDLKGVAAREAASQIALKIKKSFTTKIVPKGQEAGKVKKTLGDL